MPLSFVATSAQPDLAPQVVDWLREEFWHAGSPSREQQIATMLAQPDQSEEALVLLDDNVPVGTASLVNNDLPSRPDLTPWLASVLVLPPFRGKGIVHRLSVVLRRPPYSPQPPCGSTRGRRNRCMQSLAGSALAPRAMRPGALMSY